MSLYSDLRAINPAVAETYQNVTGADPDFEISWSGARFIMEAAARGDMQTRVTAVTALVLIWAKGPLDNYDGRSEWETAMGDLLVGKGSGRGKLLVTDAELKAVTDALDLAATHARFVSPKLLITYG